MVYPELQSLGDHVNKALEMYMRWLQDQEGVPVPGLSPALGKRLIRNGQKEEIEMIPQCEN